MNESNSKMLGNMRIKKLLIKLAVPATAAMAFNALYNLVDTLFVGWGVSQDAIGALNIAYPIQMIVLAIGLMIGVGSGSVFSRAFGRRDERAMKRAVNTALILNITLSVTISVTALIFLEPLLRFFGAVEATESSAGNIHYAREYLRIVLIALVPFSLSIVFNNLTRAEGRPKVAMNSLIIGAVVNIILDPILIFDAGLGLGVAGAAWGTVIGKSASFIYVFSRAMQRESSLMIDLKRIYQVDFSMIREILAVGSPSFVRTAMGGVLILIVNNLIILHAPEQATEYQSIYAVINRLIRFSLMPGFGLVQGMVPIVGFNFGAKFYGRVQAVIKFASTLLFIYFTSVFLLVMVFAEYLFMLFGSTTDTFISEGAQAFRIVALGFSFVTFQVILSSVYQAMGYPVKAFFIALSRRFIVYVPAAFLLASVFNLGVEGIWWAFFTADLLTGSISYLMYRGEMKTLNVQYAS